MYDYSNLIFEVPVDKDWAKKGDVYICIGTAYQLNHWGEHDEADSHVWQNQRTNKIEYDERIWNNDLEIIKN